MLEALISIAGIIITILFVVGTHEFGHFITARLVGVKVLRFSIGFGKSLFRWHGKSGTEYVFALIPLGGYVKMLDETEDQVPADELHRAYNRQPIYKKFLIVLAGPLTNLICAFLLYWVIFVMGFITIKPITGLITPDSIAYKSGMQANQQIIKVDNELTPSWMNVVFQFLYKTGDQTALNITTQNLTDGKTHDYKLDLTNWRMDNLKPDPLDSLGITPYEPTIPTVIGKIEPNTPAAAVLKVGDKITAIDKVKISTWEQFAKTVYENPGKKINLTIIRNKKKMNLPLTIGSKRELLSKERGFVGAAPDFQIPVNLLQQVKYSPFGAIPHAFKEVSNFTYLNFLLIGKMLTGKLSLQSLGGPITIFGNAGTALNSGLITFLSFLAFLSIAVGVINFLPIPGLDGGHLFIQTIESIARRPIPERVLILFYKLGLLIIFFLMFQSVTNDVMRML